MVYMKMPSFLRYPFVPLLLLLCSALTHAVAQQRPNILWITIEDTSPRFIGCYGNQAANTPTIDRLASEGVRFTNAFSTSTVCSPSRTSLITGVPTWKAGTGNHRSKYPIPDFIKGFPYYLQQAGYYTANNSKTDYNVANEKAFIQEAWNESSNHAGWWNRAHGQPFFAVFNYNDSHQSRTMTWPYARYEEEVWNKLDDSERVTDETIDVPPIYRDSPEIRKQLARIYNSLKLTDNKISTLLQRLHDENLADSTIIFFFADHGEGIPRGKTNGIAFGYRVPFVIWFPPMYRHLSPWGTNAVSNELVSFEDLAPTLISLCGSEIPAYMEGRALLGPHRDAPPPYLVLSSDRSDNGTDLVRTITDGRYLYSRNYMAYMPELLYINYMEIGEIKQEMRRDLAAGALSPFQEGLFTPRSAEYLFDTAHDPWEMNNLAEDEHHRERVQTMRHAMGSRILRGRDVLFLPEYELALHADCGKPPYQFRTDQQQYPLDAILQAAELSGRRGADVANQQVSLLTDTNGVVRYWAALGLLCQSDETLIGFSDQLARALDDPYPPVRITAAAICWSAFLHPGSIAVLTHYAEGENQHLALLSLNYMLYLPPSEQFLLTVSAIHQRLGNWESVQWACEDFLRAAGSRH